MKKILMGVFGLLLLVPGLVFAADAEAKIGDTMYATFEEAYAAIEKDGSGTIVLLKDVVLDSTLLIRDRDVTIDMNSFDISAVQHVFTVFNAKVEFKGTGVVKETTPNLGAVVLKGSSDDTAEEFSYVIVGENVTLEAWAPVFVDKNGGTTSNYGLKVDVYGKLNALNDGSGSHGFGLYVNGDVKNKTNPPIINIYDSAEIKSTGHGMYLAGYTVTTVGEASIEGVDSGIGIKSGKLNLNGATVKSTGDDSTPTSGYSDGINSSGAAVQLESNPSYTGDIEIVINGGRYESTKGITVYEYLSSAAEDTAVDKFVINNGTFVSGEGKKVFLFSKELDTKLKGFINGGTYDENPEKYLNDGFKSTIGDNVFEVSSATVPTGTSTITGNVVDDTDAAVAGATVQLKQGSTIIKSAVTDADGDYEIAEVAKGLYNIYFTLGDLYYMGTVDVNEDTEDYDATMTTGKVEIVLTDGVPDTVVNGIENLEGIAPTITLSEAEADEDDASQIAIKDLSGNKKVEFLSITIFDNLDNAVVTETSSVLEFAIQYEFKGKENIELYRYHGEEATKLTKLSARLTPEEMSDGDGSFYLDVTNNVIYLYSSNFSTYAIGYTDVVNPKTFDGVNSYVIIGLLSLLAMLSVGYVVKRSY